MRLSNRFIAIAGSGALALVPLAATALGQEYYISFFSRILVYAIAAVSLDLLLGYAGMVSLGHAAYVGVGAYVVGIFFYHSSMAEPLFTWPFVCNGSENGLVVLPLAVIVSALFAVVFGALSLRTKGMHFIMITLAFAQMLYYFFVSLDTYGGGDGLSLYSRSALPGLDLGEDVQFYYLCLGLLVLFLLFCFRLVNSRFGLVIRGGCDNERRLKALGVNVFAYRLVCFMIAGAGAGLAGALMANQTEYVSPGLMHWTLSGELMVMVLIGGMGTLFGPVVGAAVFLSLEEILAMATAHWMVYMGPFLVLVVVFARNGIFGLITSKRGSND